MIRNNSWINVCLAFLDVLGHSELCLYPLVEYDSLVERRRHAG